MAARRKKFDLILKSDESKHISPRNGYYLMIFFQCNLYHYCNLKEMNPDGVNDDVTLLRYIKIAN